ncbi:MAG TPA: MscL family protein [Micromonosporaceae bacterium]|jgi:large conductance mechanosensitive channel
MLNTLRGFKDFILRGNVIDLSVGIVVGAAFTALVGSFTEAFIKPLLQLFGANGKLPGGAFTINGSTFDWSLFANGLITFAITAAVLYFLVVMPMNKLAERRMKGIEPAPAVPSEEVILLREIRDALRGGAAVPGARTPTDSGGGATVG